ncbi:MAG: tRNA pseudouridine(13) synthase TruD [Pseudomonadota bacterium]
MRAFGPPVAKVRLKSQPDDFIVDELPNWSPSGAGEHDVLLITKIGCNTQWVARQLARYADCRERDVGYAGMKDRHARTTQWFSVWRGNRSVDWQALSLEGVVLQAVHAHHRKLRPGTLRGNRFTLRLPLVDPAAASQLADVLAPRLEQLKTRGIPNFFGEQRFGRESRNLLLAQRLAQGQRLRRNELNFAVSAARAALFNALLALRITQQTWLQARVGDALILDGSNGFFVIQDEAEALDSQRRIDAGDVHPSGPLWGDDAPALGQDVLAEEQHIAAQLPDMVAACTAARARHQRRALRVFPTALDARLDDAVVTLSFELPAGAYATMLVDQLFEVTQEADGLVS